MKLTRRKFLKWLGIGDEQEIQANQLVLTENGEVRVLYADGTSEPTNIEINIVHKPRPKLEHGDGVHIQPIEPPALGIESIVYDD